MGKTTAEWREVYKRKNERRKNRSRTLKREHREMGRALANRTWNWDKEADKGSISDE